MSRVKFALQGKCRVQNRTLQVRARATEPTVCAAAASTGLPAAGDMMRWRVQECAHRHVQLECPSRGTLRPRTGSSLAPWDPAWCTAPSAAVKPVLAGLPGSLFHPMVPEDTTLAHEA